MKAGSTVAYVECDVKDRTGRLVARAASTCIKLNPESKSGTWTGVPRKVHGQTEKNRQILLQPRERRASLDNFKLVGTAVPEAGPGQMLLHTVYLSLDPYMHSGVGRRGLVSASR